MALEFTDCNSSPVIRVDCNNQKVAIKRKWHENKMG